jgi:benzoylformate decarboxylase
MQDSGSSLTALRLFEVLSECILEDYIVVSESPSNMAEFSQTAIGRITKPDSFYMTASGGLGWGIPAAVGLAFAEDRTGRKRPVIAIVGDGSFQFSPQSIWTSVQCGLHVVFVVLQNEQYKILKMSASEAGLDNVPGLDIPGIDIVSLAKGYGAKACRAETSGHVRECFSRSLYQGGVTVIAVSIEKIPEK